MRLIALDTETELIARGRQVPPGVCLTWAELDLRPGTAGKILKSGIIGWAEARAFVLLLLRDPDVEITGASIAYDVLVTSALWPNPDPHGPSYDEEVLGDWIVAYDHDRVSDVLVRQKLLDLAAGCYRRQQLQDGRWVHHRYNLAAVTKRLTAIALDKGDAKPKKSAGAHLTEKEQQAAREAEQEDDEEEGHWRLRYAELKDKPVSEWPRDAVAYAVRDAEASALCWWAQQSPDWRRRVVGQSMGGSGARPTAAKSTASVRTTSQRPVMGGPPPLTKPHAVNIWSGTTDGPLAAALTNPTELSFKKGRIAKRYPLDFKGRVWLDLEEAWFALSPGHTDRDGLMVEMIAEKFRQHPELASEVSAKGGADWLAKCDHFTNAKSPSMQAWEGKGEESRFIRNLVSGFLVSQGLQRKQAPTSTYIPPEEQRVTAAPDWLWARVRESFGDHADPFADEHRQARGALWLRAMSAHGLVTDAQAVERFAERVTKKHAEVTARLVTEGLVRVEYHLNTAALRKRVQELGGVGTKKAELLSLAYSLHGQEAEEIKEAAGWLSLIKLLRSTDSSTDSSTPTAEAYQSFATLERAGLAYKTFHRNTKAAAHRMVEACEAAGIQVPRTDSYDPDKHAIEECVCLDRDACNAIDDAVLQDYSELSHLAKMLAADVPVLRSGTTVPIHTHFEELLETGRTGSSKPNVQNRARGEKCHACGADPLLRKTCQPCMGTGAELGDRECFIPRSGNVIVDSDYSLGELHTLAQLCLWVLGHSKMAVVLREGKDPHTVIACRILKVTYEEGLKLKKAKDPKFDDARNAGKGVNFGKPGGLGVKTMRAYAVKTYNVDKSEEEWVIILAEWDATWTEMPAYFEWVNKLPKRQGQASIQRGLKGEVKVQQLYSVVQQWSGRLRAGATYCSACNTGYQGLLADVAKRAGWYLLKACYLSPARLQADAERYAPSGAARSRPRGEERADRFAGWRGEFSRETQLELAKQAERLHGCRPVNFIHDQFLVEAAEARGENAAAAVGDLMNRAGSEILPDVPVRCTPLLARRWSKRADEVRVEGKLVAWEDPRLAARS